MTVEYDTRKGGARFRKGEHVESRNSGRHGTIARVIVADQVYLVRWSGIITARGAHLNVGKNPRPSAMDEGDLYHLRRRRRAARYRP